MSETNQAFDPLPKITEPEVLVEKARAELQQPTRPICGADDHCPLCQLRIEAARQKLREQLRQERGDVVRSTPTAMLMVISRWMRQLGDEIKREYGTDSQPCCNFLVTADEMEQLIDSVGAREEILRDVNA